MRCLDLFSGIGGFAVGFHAAGIETVGFCEINPYARKVLARRFPGTPIHNDITTLKGDQFGPVEIVSGGFPCQDISAAGRGAGLSGSRSGLWYEMHRVISEARPRFVVIENSPLLRRRGLEDVLGGLNALGYDAEWHCIPAGALGAPHRRDRLWIVAYTASYGQQGCYSSQPHDNAARIEENSQFAGNSARSGTNSVVANAFCPGLAAPEQSNRQEPPGILSEEIWHAVTERSWWPPEPAVGRVAHGVPNRVDRLRCLGNAVVPAIPYLIGTQIMDYAFLSKKP